MGSKSSVRMVVDETWTLLERYGAYMRDTRTVKGFKSGHEGGAPGLDDDTALRVEDALRWLKLKDDQMYMAVLMYFRGEKVDKRDDDNLPVVYYAPRNYREIGAIYRQGYSWAMGMVSGGVCVLEGRLSG